MEVFYLAGPMSGYPQFNIPLFDRVSRILRLGNPAWAIISPAELDSDAVRTAALASKDGILIDNKIAGETWGDILARDVRIVANECDGIIFLPGWVKSRGARLEATVGLLQRNFQFMLVDPRYIARAWINLTDVSQGYIARELYTQFGREIVEKNYERE